MAQITHLLYKHKKLSDGTYPIMVRLAIGDSRKLISTGYSASDKTWDEKNKKPRQVHPDKDDIESKITTIEGGLQKALKTLKAESDYFSANDVYMLYIKEEKDSVIKSTLLTFMDSLIKSLQKSEKFGNANVYKDTKRRLIEFMGKKDISLRKIDVAYFLHFETFLKERLNDVGSRFVYLRTFRAVINRAKKLNYYPKSKNPFEGFDWSVYHKHKPQKRALSIADFDKIEKVNLDENPELLDSRNIFLFSYYTRGTNFTDMARIKWEQVSAMGFTYVRRKTNSKFNITFLNTAQRIIDYYGNTSVMNPSDYVFPILDAKRHKSEKSVFNRCHKMLTKFNKDLKEIAKLAGVQANCSSYVSRHSWGSHLKQRNVPIAVIQESYQHASSEQTETYLREIDDSELHKTLEKAFGNIS